MTRGFFDTLRLYLLENFAMKATPLEEIASKINDLLADSPARDIKKNLGAVAQSVATRLDLVPREEFEVQQAILLKTREMVEALEARVAALEKSLPPPV
jgi:BMFP domain-containing protein YqiC